MHSPPSLVVQREIVGWWEMRSLWWWAGKKWDGAHLHGNSIDANFSGSSMVFTLNKTQKNNTENLMKLLHKSVLLFLPLLLIRYVCVCVIRGRARPSASCLRTSWPGQPGSQELSQMMKTTRNLRRCWGRLRQPRWAHSLCPALTRPTWQASLSLLFCLSLLTAAGAESELSSSGLSPDRIMKWWNIWVFPQREGG